MNTCRKAVITVLAVILAVMLLSFTCAASENIGEPIILLYNDNPIDGGLCVGETAYAPYRALIRAIEPDTEFSWNQKKVATTASGDGIVINATAGSNYIEANGRIIYNDTAENLIINETLYVPVSSIANAYSLAWSFNPSRMRSCLAGIPEPILNADEFYDAESLYWLSRIISAESRGESLRGQIAVGNVVIGRTRSSAFPDTIYGVIFDFKYGTQFTPAKTGSVYKAPTDSAVLAAKIALEGYQIVDALYFCTVRVSNGSWIARTRQYVDTIGNHRFYY